MAIANNWAWTEVVFFDGSGRERLGSAWTNVTATSRCHEVCKLAFEELLSSEPFYLQQIGTALDGPLAWSRRKTVGLLNSERRPIPVDLDNADFLLRQVPDVKEILVVFHA